jgi:hypothetical protein
MPRNRTAVTRYVSFLDSSRQPLLLRLAHDQEVLKEEAPEVLEDGQCLRFLFVRGPADRPVHLIRQDRLPDGSAIWVRYDPEVDEPCGWVQGGGEVPEGTRKGWQAMNTWPWWGQLLFLLGFYVVLFLAQTLVDWLREPARK